MCGKADIEPAGCDTECGSGCADAAPGLMVRNRATP